VWLYAWGHLIVLCHCLMGHLARASEVTILWRYTNLFIIIIIFLNYYYY